MDTYWGMKKNDIRNLMSIPIALTPCLKAECDQWRGGECIQIRKAGKPDEPQVFNGWNLIHSSGSYRFQSINGN